VLAAGLVCFSMIAVLAGVAHAFHRARRAPELLVGHALALTSVFLVVVGAGSDPGETAVGAIFAGYAAAMLLSLSQGPPALLRVIVRVAGALVIAGAVAIDTLALLERAAPLAGRVALSVAVVALAVLAIRAALDHAPSRPKKIAAWSAGILLGLGGALSVFPETPFLLPLIAAHALVTLLRVAPERLPALADLVSAAIATVMAAAAALAIGAPLLTVAGLAGVSVLALTSLSRLLVGNARVFSVGAVARPARPAPRLPLDELTPLYERYPTAAPARGRATARSLLEDAVEGSSGRFMVDDRTLDADVSGDLPRIVSALRSALSAASLDDEIVQVVMRAGPRSVAFELDQPIPAETVERAQGLLASHGGRVFVTPGSSATQIVVPVRPVGGEA
jgi:hypothetical protein